MTEQYIWTPEAVEWAKGIVLSVGAKGSISAAELGACRDIRGSIKVDPVTELVDEFMKDMKFSKPSPIYRAARELVLAGRELGRREAGK